MRILYAEDERSMSEAVCDVLTFNKYSVDCVYDGEEAYSYASLSEYDGIILDIMMPKMDGLTVLKKLRAEGNNTPVLLLTAKAEIEDQIEGLDLGADDYLPKPFSMNLLLARLRAMMRRKEEFIPDTVTLGNISLDQKDFKLRCGDKEVVLTNLEYSMMELFMRNKNNYFKTEDLLTKVWGYETDAENGTVWVYISYLRKHLADIGANVNIVAKRNIGYRIEEVSDKES
ncbi:MAG: response regulator transcription factor [Lachnospiraceae bacterium]|nr:response regulator transcription factor [Lachnospiraceae bacterium]